MAKKDDRPYEFRIKELELEVEDRERELIAFRDELGKINQQLEKFINQMSDQLRLANLIQKALVPTEIPTIPGFEFSTKFVASHVAGGDYFDVFELEDKLKFGLLMANSTGHGMASLFLSVLLKLTTQIEAKGLDPSQVLKRMFDEIKDKVKDAQSSHVFYGVVDRRTLELSYSMSGQVLAYIYKYDHDKFVRLESTQVPLGEKITKAGFKQESLVLDPRDKIVLISEGILKVKNKKGQLFTEQKLLDFLVEHTSSTPHEIRNEIFFQAKHFAQGEDLPQDISVVVMRVKDKILKLKKV